MNYILLATGGACGAMARYKAGEHILRHKKGTFPWGTIFINITGALLLGIFVGLGLGGNAGLLLGDGFCGAFTTFSTFTVESAHLFRRGAAKKGLFTILVSAAAGFALFFIGYYLGTFFAS